LTDRRRDIPGIGLGHGLDNNRRSTAHGDTADEDLAGFSAGYGVRRSQVFSQGFGG
jgi:hypothetical protein